MNRVRIGSKGEYRQRINSGGPLTQKTGKDGRGHGGGSLLEDIDEENTGPNQKDRGGTINVEFLKNAFQQFTMNPSDTIEL